MVWACEKWHNYLWGRPFLIQTDHANLKWLETSAPTKGRLSRWACRLAEFDYRLEHKPGKENSPPDALSRNVPRPSGVEAEPEPEEDPAWEPEGLLSTPVAAAPWVRVGGCGGRAHQFLGA